MTRWTVILWDFDNRLLAADVDQDGTAECGYQYDALGRRVSKTIPDGEGPATGVFLSDGRQVVAEYAADAAPASAARKFVYGDYVDEPVMMVTGDSQAETGYYYHQNSLYSVAAMSDASSAVVERYAYSAYGKPLYLDANANLLNPQASTIGNPYLFTARRLDPETGLYYYRARMYDVELGRFLGRDPIGYKGSRWGLYEYVSSKPGTRLDPTGQVSCEGMKSLATILPPLVDRNGRPLPPTPEGDCGNVDTRLDFPKPRRTILDYSCTAPCTILHENIHLSQFGDANHPAGACYKAAKKAYDHANTAEKKEEKEKEWQIWLASAERRLECPAYLATLACMGNLYIRYACPVSPSGLPEDLNCWDEQCLSQLMGWATCCSTSIPDGFKMAYEGVSNNCSGLGGPWPDCPFP